jgi:hypothetical protein
MPAIGGPGLPSVELHLKAHLAHQPGYTLVIYPPVCSPQFSCNAAVAIGRPLASQPFDSLAQVALVPLRRLIIVTATRQAHHLADDRHRIGLSQFSDYHSLFS